MVTQTLIIGGGLSGLRLAELLEDAGHDYLLLEARDRFGGRVLSAHVGGAAFDLGPAWFWPGQPRIEALIQRLGLAKFDQYAQGALLMEDAQGNVHRNQGYASMQGSWRLEDGLGVLIDALTQKLPKHRTFLNAQATKIARSDCVEVTLSTGDVVTANQVVLALPPRVASEINYVPALPPTTISSMGNIATWMAGQAKAIAVYDTAFWRNDGLSGDAMSRFGPMVEVHDASPIAGGPYALFGFIGVPPEGRQDEELLRQHLLAQLERLFGSQAANPKELLIKDWAFDALTATEADIDPLYAHPTYAPLAPLWGGKILFSGTEVAPQFGGYLEGALEAAENTALALIDP